MSTNTILVYVPLLNEGTEVYRPTTGVLLDHDLIQIEPTDDYDADSEEWEFPPGSTVRCERQIRNGDEVLVAKRRA